MLKALFVVEKNGLIRKAKLKIYDITNKITNIYNTHIAIYLKNEIKQ